MIQNHYHNTSERNEHILPWYHRKTNRLKDYDYSSIGAYFITICIQERHEILCKIVGDGFPVPHEQNIIPTKQNTAPHIQLTEYGEIVDEYIHTIPKKYPHIRVDTYVIMPDHVHMVLTIVGEGSPLPQNNYGKNINNTHGTGINNTHGTGNPSPTTTIGNIIGWFKYQTTKQINILWNTPGQHIWQRSYHDHIIRSEQDYHNICQYINENPMRWLQKHSHH
jgi:REP element-mobilizing transposase RayT